MAKMTSLEDLGGLLSDRDREQLEEKGSSVTGAPSKGAPSETKKGYDGKAQKLVVALDSKRRRGNVVTLITGFQSTPGELEEIAGMLKRACGAGGRVLDNAIEIQGDHRAVAVEKLQGRGYQIRKG